MESHVPTLETCQKLKATGLPQETFFYWTTVRNVNEGTYFGEVGEWVLLSHGLISHLKDNDLRFAAPLLTEILEQLPVAWDLNKSALRVSRPTDTDWLVYYAEYGNKSEEYSKESPNPAEAAALLWLELNAR